MMLQQSNEEFDQSTSTINFNDKALVSTAKNFSFDYRDRVCDVRASIRIINLMKGNHVAKYDEWEIDLNIFSLPTNCNLGFHSNLKIIDIDTTIVYLYTAIVFLFVLLNIYALGVMSKDSNTGFLRGVSTCSLGIIIAQEFQLFGYNLVLGLLNNIDFFGYLSFIGVCIFFGILIKLRITFNVINIQNENLNMGDAHNPIMYWGFKLVCFMAVK